MPVATPLSLPLYTRQRRQCPASEIPHAPPLQIRSPSVSVAVAGGTTSKAIASPWAPAADGLKIPSPLLFAAVGHGLLANYHRPPALRRRRLMDLHAWGRSRRHQPSDPRCWIRAAMRTAGSEPPGGRYRRPLDPPRRPCSPGRRVSLHSGDPHLLRSLRTEFDVAAARGPTHRR